MKNLLTIISSFSLICLLYIVNISFAQAQDGKWMIGGKQVEVTNDSLAFRNAEGSGIIVGYHFAKPVGETGSGSIELEYIQTDNASTIPVDINRFIGFIGEWEADIFNLLFSYRTGGNFFFKAKGGLQYSSMTLRNASPFGFSGDIDDVSVIYGLGFGARITDFGLIEVEYTAETGDNNLGMYQANAIIQF